MRYIVILSIILNTRTTMHNDLNNIRAAFSAALKEENLKKLEQLIEKLIKSYKKVPRKERKDFGIESLKIFNMQNYKGRNLIMIAADYGRADLLKKLYDIPERLTHDKYSPKELKEVYKQRIFSYIAKDTQGSDQFFKKDNDSYNALMLTINSGHSECIRFLLCPETAITLNQKDKHGKTALIHAIESGDLNLIEEFLSVIQEILGGINQYDPKCKIKLEIDDETEKHLKKAIDNNENIKLTVTKFLEKIKEHIFMPCKIPLSSLKRKNAEQGNEIPDKKRKYDYKNIEKKTLKLIQDYTNLLKQTKNSVGINGLMIAKEYGNNIKQLIKNCTIFTPDHKSKLHKKLKNLEEKRQEIGESLLKKLLNQANESDLTDEKKEEILDDIKKLIMKEKIEFPEYLIQKIPENIILNVIDIITVNTINYSNNGPNIQEAQHISRVKEAPVKSSSTDEPQSNKNHSIPEQKLQKIQLCQVNVNKRSDLQKKMK